MGGRSRNEKRKRQEVAAKRSAAPARGPRRSMGDRTPLLVVAGVVAVAVLIGLGAWLARGSGGEPVAATYPVSVDDAVVTAGADAPVVVDIYTDYICPACAAFEDGYGDELTEALNAGRVTARYHPVGLLDQNSDPAGYSSRAANASVCAASAGVFPDYQERLFDEQPRRGTSGPSDEELVAFGAELGADGDFAECVTTGRNADGVAEQTRTMVSDPALRNPDGDVGTPTVTVDGQRVDLNDPAWLAGAVGD